MIPIGDENKRGFIPFINYLLVASNIVIYFLFLPESNAAAETFFKKFGLIPVHLVNNPSDIKGYLSIFSSMFLHGGLLHLAGNMLYLWIFGDNIEYAIGHFRYFIFYLLVGIAAAVTQIMLDPTSDVPMIGASGAISGVLGAYLIKYPMNKVSILFFLIIIIRVIKVPALIVLLLWFIFQVWNGYYHMNSGLAGGVAWFAHIGGFVAGFVLVKFFELSKPKKQPRF